MEIPFLKKNLSFGGLQVEKQNAHFFNVTILQAWAQANVVVLVTYVAQSKFKVNIFA
jgi:hypothetical protein